MESDPNAKGVSATCVRVGLDGVCSTGAFPLPFPIEDNVENIEKVDFDFLRGLARVDVDAYGEPAMLLLLVA